ncbi:hypothetical protein ACFYZ5_45175 [Streptomyces chartreusis]|uniref:hypothetical protein n=1 Tax=Streptomyces chartreusis TaxID=1969 RepID=UPI0036873714
MSNPVMDPVVFVTVASDGLDGGSSSCGEYFRDLGRAISMPRGHAVALPGLGRGDLAEDMVPALAAPDVELLDEGEELGAGGGPVGPGAVLIASLSRARKAYRGSVCSSAATALSQAQLIYFAGGWG